MVSCKVWKRFYMKGRKRIMNWEYEIFIRHLISYFENLILIHFYYPVTPQLDKHLYLMTALHDVITDLACLAASLAYIRYQDPKSTHCVRISNKEFLYSSDEMSSAYCEEVDCRRFQWQTLAHGGSLVRGFG